MSGDLIPAHNLLIKTPETTGGTIFVQEENIRGGTKALTGCKAFSIVPGGGPHGVTLWWPSHKLQGTSTGPRHMNSSVLP